MYSSEQANQVELSNSSCSSSPRRSRISSSSSGSELFVPKSASPPRSQSQRSANPTRSPPQRSRTRSNNRPKTRADRRLSADDDDEDETELAQTMPRSQSASANHRRGNNNFFEKLEKARKAAKTKKTRPIHSAPPRCYRNMESLNHPRLTRGQRNYLWDIAYVYDVAPMKRKLKTQYEAHILHEHELGTMENFDIEQLIDRVHQPRKLVFMKPGEYEEKIKDWNKKHGKDTEKREKRERPSTAPVHRNRPISAVYTQPARPKTAAPSRPKTAHHQRHRTTMNKSVSTTRSDNNSSEPTLVSQFNGIDLSDDSEFDA